jgi:uroporphyrinogen decarboxylase
MSQRERVVRALSREVPDRVPVTLYCGFSPTLMDKFHEMTGADSPPDHFNYDARGVAALPFPKEKSYDFSQIDYSEYHPELPEGATIGANGVASARGSLFHFRRSFHPLKEARTAADITSYPYFVGCEAQRKLRTREEALAKIRPGVEEVHTGGRAAYGGGGSIFESAWAYRGLANMLTDFLENEDVAAALLDEMARNTLDNSRNLAEAGVDVIIFGDDVATQNGMMMSPAIWRKWLKPRWHEVFQQAQQTNRDVHIFYHSDGNIQEIIPDLIEIGVTVLNPVQPECMDPAEIKQQYGDQLAFWGTVGTQTTMPFGTPEEVRAVVKERIETVGKGGGLLIAPTHMLEPEVPWENVVAFFEAIDEYGWYA